MVPLLGRSILARRYLFKTVFGSYSKCLRTSICEGETWSRSVPPKCLVSFENACTSTFAFCKSLFLPLLFVIARPQHLLFVSIRFSPTTLLLFSTCYFWERRPLPFVVGSTQFSLLLIQSLSTLAIFWGLALIIALSCYLQAKNTQPSSFLSANLLIIPTCECRPSNPSYVRADFLAICEPKALATHVICERWSLNPRPFENQVSYPRHLWVLALNSASMRTISFPFETDSSQLMPFRHLWLIDSISDIYERMSIKPFYFYWKH